MKLTITLLLLLVAGRLSAQRLTGLLMGELTRMPLGHATVSVGNISVQTNANGIFTINGAKATDSIRINCAGYTYYSFKPNYSNHADTLVIYLSPISYVLKEVQVKSTRNFKADSLRTRKNFAGVFAYKGTSVADVLIKKGSVKYVPNNYIDAPNSTTSLVGFDVLRLVSFLSKKKDTKSKLKQMLLRDEANNYVEQSFSQEKVVALTGLKGDSLYAFMDHYRPSPSLAKQMTAYTVITYIRKCYAEFMAVPKK